MARAAAWCRSVSMPSATTTAPVRSAWALTASTTAATARLGRSWIRCMSSLMMSGRSNAKNVRDWSSAPTSSSAIRQPIARTSRAARSSSAGRDTNDRSVTSRTICGWSGNAWTRSPKSCSAPVSMVAGSTLTNSANPRRYRPGRRDATRTVDTADPTPPADRMCGPRRTGHQVDAAHQPGPGSAPHTRPPHPNPTPQSAGTRSAPAHRPTPTPASMWCPPGRSLPGP